MPTGTPRSPLYGAKKFDQPLEPSQPAVSRADDAGSTRGNETDAKFGGTAYANERYARRLSYHTDFSTPPTGTTKADFTNQLTGRGPLEGRPPGEIFVDQRWDEFLPKEGYIFTLGKAAATQSFFAPGNGTGPFQAENAVWTYGTGNSGGAACGTFPPLIKGRYGVPIATRIYNYLPTDRTQNGGFGQQPAPTALPQRPQRCGKRHRRPPGPPGRSGRTAPRTGS